MWYTAESSGYPIIIILAEIVTAVMNTIMGIIWWGSISYDLILIGTIDALVGATIVGTIVLYIIEQLRETEGKYREVAEQERVKCALRESEERFREIFEQNADALLVLERLSGKIMDANPAASDIFGYTRQEFMAEGLSLLALPQEHERFVNNLIHAGCSEQRCIARLTCRKKDGTTLITSFWGREVRLKKNDVLFCSFRDITEKLRREDETKLLQAKLIQMNKMTSLCMLVSGIAHEINNPNHFIAVNAQMVSDAWKDASKVLSAHYNEHGDFPLGGVPYSEMRYIMPQLLTAMSEGAARIKNIIDNLKDFSKQGAVTLDSAVDINKVIASSTALLHCHIVALTDRFKVIEGLDLPPARGSRQQLEQVVINLIMNALQSLRDRNAGVTVTSSFDRNTGSILVQVTDEGVGIPWEALLHITEPFYTTKSDEGGTGLGLSISFSLIQAHKGALTFLSEPGKGTTATISIPAYYSASERNGHASEHIS